MQSVPVAETKLRSRLAKWAIPTGRIRKHPRCSPVACHYKLNAGASAGALLVRADRLAGSNKLLAEFWFQVHAIFSASHAQPLLSGFLAVSRPSLVNSNPASVLGLWLTAMRSR